MSLKNDDDQQYASTYFPFFRFEGKHGEVGEQYGEACSGLIHKHLDSVRNKLEVGTTVSLEYVTEMALRYQPYVKKYAPFLDEEVQGIAKGANITLGEAYLLQVRAEMNNDVAGSQHACTTFATSPSVTKNGIPLAGQNVDLPSFYSEIGVVMELVPDDGPAILMFAPAGQVSHIGISSRGMTVFANAITSDGWGEGFPRYMFSRLALTCETVGEAVQKLRGVQRSSARNMLLMDKNGDSLDYENTPANDAVMRPENGILVHTNHYVAEDMLGEERLRGMMLENSQVRLERMKTLLHEASYSKELDLADVKGFFRDRANAPNSICQTPADGEALGKDVKTCASVISFPSKGELWVAVGPPNAFEYKCYRFSE